MEFTIFLQTIQQFLGQDLFAIFWQLFIYGGWSFVAFGVFYLIYFNYLQNQANKFAAKVNFVNLAIDVPRNNEQTPQAAENIFIHLAGGHSPYSDREKLLEGKFQIPFSCDIVSIDGNVQFIIRTPDYHRDLVEAAVYAQYPDAQISEMEDYAAKAFRKFPDEEWDIWGTELVLSSPEIYPIRTYEAFEDKIKGEINDPMAALLEIMSRFNPGEQMWLQFILWPENPSDARKKAAQKEVNKLLGRASGGKSGGFLSGIVRTFFDETLNQLTGLFGVGGESAPAKSEKAPLLTLSLREKQAVEGIDDKINQIIFDVKIRMLYVARKEVMDKAKASSAVFGAIKQFNTWNYNGLKPLSRTRTHSGLLNNWVRSNSVLNQRKNTLMSAYVNRSRDIGAQSMMLSVKELATLWHFPMITVKAPAVMMAGARRGSAPGRLPTNVSRAFGSGESVDAGDLYQGNRSTVSQADDDSEVDVSDLFGDDGPASVADSTQEESVWTEDAQPAPAAEQPHAPDREMDASDRIDVATAKNEATAQEEPQEPQSIHINPEREAPSAPLSSTQPSATPAPEEVVAPKSRERRDVALQPLTRPISSGSPRPETVSDRPVRSARATTDSRPPTDGVRRATRVGEHAPRAVSDTVSRGPRSTRSITVRSRAPRRETPDRFVAEPGSRQMVDRAARSVASRSAVTESLPNANKSPFDLNVFPESSTASSPELFAHQPLNDDRSPHEQQLPTQAPDHGIDEPVADTRSTPRRTRPGGPPPNLPVV